MSAFPGEYLSFSLTCVSLQLSLWLVACDPPSSATTAIQLSFSSSSGFSCIQSVSCFVTMRHFDTEYASSERSVDRRTLSVRLPNYTICWWRQQKEHRSKETIGARISHSHQGLLSSVSLQLSFSYLNLTPNTTLPKTPGSLSLSVLQRVRQSSC